MKTNLTALILVLLGLVLVFGGTRKVLQPRSSVAAAFQQNTREKSIKEKAGPPTRIEEGVMTSKQKKHSLIFKRFEGATRGRKLRDLITEGQDVTVVNMVADGKVGANFDLNSYLTTMTCRASAVVLATVSSKASQIIDEGTFTFTDYELTVNEILKNDRSSHIGSGETITYTSPGGSVELNGRTISAVDYRGEPLQIGEQYLLFLNFIPDTGSYKGFSDDVNGDTFEIKNGTIIQASKKPLPLGTKRTSDSESFMAAVRLSTAQSCPN